MTVSVTNANSSDDCVQKCSIGVWWRMVKRLMPLGWQENEVDFAYFAYAAKID
jgi:hypothetical protein